MSIELGDCVKLTAEYIDHFFERTGFNDQTPSCQNIRTVLGTVMNFYGDNTALIHFDDRTIGIHEIQDLEKVDEELPKATE
jgi:hypothetical protein